ncbi:MAG: DUF6048 family protein [Paludibacteraceae bacterium]
MNSSIFHRVLGVALVLGCSLSILAATDSTAVARRKDGTRIYADTAIYQGMSLKIDIANTIIEAATSKGKVQSYELAMNWRLKQRFFPTLELGYAQAEAAAAGGQHSGKGGFGRVGLDMNGLKKHPENRNALLVGLRVGTAMQQYDMTGVALNGGYWGDILADYMGRFRADCWGEVVAGCQVQVWEGFQMGWYLRFKILFTRKAKEGEVMPYYIPGFGYRDDTNWGINYYIGYTF